MITNFFHSMIMVRSGGREIIKEKLHAAKKPIKIWDFNVDNIVISKLVKTKKFEVFDWIFR